MFDKIKGQDNPISILKSTIIEDKLSHSYLFMGPDGVGKFTTALYFGMAINCLSGQESRPCGVCASCRKMLSFNHPDLLYIFPTPNYDISPEGEIKDNKDLEEYESYRINKRETPWKTYFFKGNTAIRLDCIRLLQHRINLSRNEGRYKVFIVEKADQMNLNAANAFLKTLEEPPDDVVIILTSSKYEALLPTIISRCQKLVFNKIPRRIIEQELFSASGEDTPLTKMISRIANGNMEKALNALQSQRSETRAKMIELISFIVKGDDLGFIPFSEEYKTSKTLSELTEIIQYLLVWVGDLALINVAPEEIVNIDLISDLEALADSSSSLTDRCPELVLFLEEMLKKLEGNVNPHLVLIEIYHRLKYAVSG